MGQDYYENQKVNRLNSKHSVNSVTVRSALCYENVTRSAHCSALKVFYTNADCLLNKFDEFCLRVNDSMCDIIAVTEGKPKNDRYKLDVSELQLENYDIHDHFSEYGRGIIIYTHRTLKVSKLKPKSSFKDHYGLTLKPVIQNF